MRALPFLQFTLLEIASWRDDVRVVRLLPSNRPRQSAALHLRVHVRKLYLLPRPHRLAAFLGARRLLVTSGGGTEGRPYPFFLGHTNPPIDSTFYGTYISTDIRMNTISAGEIKRRGISAVDKAAENGPVHVIKESRLQYVVMSEADYQQLLTDLSTARVQAAEADLKAGRVRRGTAAQLMREIRKDA